MITIESSWICSRGAEWNKNAARKDVNSALSSESAYGRLRPFTINIQSETQYEKARSSFE